MLHVKTESGSVYQVDDAQHRVARLSGIKPPTERIGADGAYRTYAELVPATPMVGKPLLIVWRVNDEGITETTLTSVVREVQVVPDA